MAEKVLDRRELAGKIEGLKARGRKIVLADGCFDLLHVGHVRYLRAAKAMGDVLVLALNSDASVKRLKGEGRPLLPLEDRLGVLSAFEMVDFVTSFDEDTAGPLLAELKPHVHACRSAAPPAASFGGETLVVKEGTGFTTDKLIGEILRKYGSKKD